MALSKNAKTGIVVGGLGLLTFGGILYFASRAGAAPPEGYCCPYCSECFATYEELVDHVKTEHPGERIPLPIEWD